MIFNPLVRRRSANVNVPAGYDAPASPGMAPAQQPQVDPATRTPTTSSQNFQNSLQTERALTANKAANFSAMAPLPSSNSASAYGSVDASQAARSAYVDDHRAQADLYSGGYFTGQQLAQDENARENAQSGAQVKLAGSQTNINNANASVGIPADAKLKGAQAGGLEAQAAETKAMTPERVVGQRIQNSAAAYMAPMAPLMAGAQIERAKAETAAIQQKTPAEVKAIEGNSGAGAEINRQKSGLIDEQQRLLNAKMANMAPAAPAVDPVAQVDAQEKAYKLAKQQGEDQYNAQGRGYRWFGAGQGKDQGQLTQEAFKNLTPAAPAATQKKVKRYGALNGRKVAEYEDGSIDYVS